MDSDRWEIAQQGWVASLVAVGGMSVMEEVAALADISLHQNTAVGCCTADYHTKIKVDQSYFPLSNHC